MKSHQLQIRVTPQQKALLRRRARAAGVDMSTYVLARVLPRVEEEVEDVLAAVADVATRRFGLAAFHDLLVRMDPRDWDAALDALDVAHLPPEVQNTLAAMVEMAAALQGCPIPEWTAAIPPLARPHFATDLKSLRPHLIRTSPVAFRRRNLFVDAAIGQRA